MSGGMPVYRKQGDPDTWLIYYPPLNQWCVKNTTHKGIDLKYACLKCNPPCLPENGTKRTWNLWEDINNKFVVQEPCDCFVLEEGIV